MSVLFTFGAAQTVWCCVVPELSAPVILGMDWLTQLNPKINWAEKIIEWTSNNMNVFLKACCLSKAWASVGLLNLISVHQVNNLVLMAKGKNVRAWIV